MEAEKLSKTFCILPWIHWNFPNDGKITPCSLGNLNYTLGNIKENSIEEIWNNENYKQLRKNMLEGKHCPECSHCYLREEIGATSSRLEANREFSDYLGLIENTKDDGSLTTQNIAFLAIRFSNKCNFKCRTCCPENSSSIAYEYANLFGPMANKNQEISIPLDKLINLANKLKRCTFSGGEPLIHDKHYLFLEHLININKSIELIYHTNLSTFSYKSWNVLKMWNQFENVSIFASLDDVGERGEFIRKGFRWPQFIKNIKILKLFAPHVHVKINLTISVFNVLYLENIFETLLVEKIIKNRSDVLINILTEPTSMNIQFLKDRIILDDFPEVQNFINLGNLDFNIGKADFIKFNSLLDSARLESWRSIFPELAAIIGENEII